MEATQNLRQELTELRVELEKLHQLLDDSVEEGDFLDTDFHQAMRYLARSKGKVQNLEALIG